MGIHLLIHVIYFKSRSSTLYGNIFILLYDSHLSTCFLSMSPHGKLHCRKGFSDLTYSARKWHFETCQHVLYLCLNLGIHSHNWLPDLMWILSMRYFDSTLNNTWKYLRLKKIKEVFGLKVSISTFPHIWWFSQESVISLILMMRR